MLVDRAPDELEPQFDSAAAARRERMRRSSSCNGRTRRGMSRIIGFLSRAFPVYAARGRARSGSGRPAYVGADSRTGESDGAAKLLVARLPSDVEGHEPRWAEADGLL